MRGHSACVVILRHDLLAALCPWKRVFVVMLAAMMSDVR